ncbi:ankyrin repeat domain-containing protein 6 [Myzus persicae]|uniref:ankyrin repeat domain-containing protein 6 n=1 Tax=Myzus persicae TaxID=13164 RepID=UPI000B9390E6|nr:ankyrin repeat domain-containing protein 6 [Myzus persicae]XP_022177263.1 ankyrin repeat domain-containing protein 6 [Myzus persicae]
MVDLNPVKEPMLEDGRTALHYAASTGDSGSVAELLATGTVDANAQDAVGYSAVQIAAAEGHLDVLRLLLRHDANVNLHDNLHGNTALHEASWKGYSKTVALLASSGSDLDRKNYGGSSALHLCCQNGHNQSCRELLLAGCDPDVQNNYGDTPLHTSARYGHAGVLRILISAQCKVSEQNKNGDTVLHIAAAMARKKLTKIILQAKCNIALKNKQNETARDIAERKNLTDILEILKNPTYKKKGSSSKTKKDSKDSKKRTDTNVKKQWSPYGCHYFPDTKEFPKPKLNSLPEEPLHAGEQYYLDLAGNIRKGPVGVGYTCYCAPFFKELEARLDHNTKKLKRQICRTEDNINRRLCSVEKQLKRSNEKLQQVAEEVSDNDSELENRFRTECAIDTTVMDPNLRWRLDYLTARRHDDIPCNDSGYSTKMFSNSQGPSPSLSNLMENGTVPIIESSKMPKSLSVLPDNSNMESIV